jgi:alkylated DNA repair dioxygenase AlkB
MQASLFGGERPFFDAEFRGARRERLTADAWIEHAPNWLGGHQRLFEQLLGAVDWHHQRRQMYDREVDVPRLVARAPEGGEPGELLRVIARTLSARYRVALESISLAYYRNGQDSVAPHGDKMGLLRANTVIAILSVGEPRRFTLRSIDGDIRRLFSLGWGDLLVMGGSCQETFLHGVPKVKHANPRMSIQFREHLPAVVKAYPDDITASVRVRVG